MIPTTTEPSRAAVLFSGGSDSTLTAALTAERFDQVHLLTFKRHGIFNVEHARVNVARLQARYGAERFVHHFIDVNKLFRRVSYDRYLASVRRHGFLVLSTCGLCKLAMHLRALIYCLDHRIQTICDGANRAMNIYPAQMEPVIAEVRQMYARFGVSYETPVFDYDGPSEMTYSAAPPPPGDGGFYSSEDAHAPGSNTTDRKLYELGIFEAPSTKGTPTDHAMQPRCFQFVLFRVFAHWYYLPHRPYEQYVADTVGFHRERIQRFAELLQQHLNNPKKSPLRRYL